MQTAPPTRRIKDQLYEQLARISKALSSPKRLELVELLCQCPRTVEALAELADMSVANTSQHLGVLREARLVVGSREGAHVRYQLADTSVAAVFGHLRALAALRLAEVHALLRALDEGSSDIEALSGPALLERVEHGEVIVIDVRPREEFEAGHWPGARSVPPGELKAELGSLPSGAAVVAYCRGPYCVYARDAARVLADAGHPTARLVDGPAEWVAAGLTATHRTQELP